MPVARATLDATTFVELPIFVSGAILDDTGLAIGPTRSSPRARAKVCQRHRLIRMRRISSSKVLQRGCLRDRVGTGRLRRLDLDALVAGSRLPADLRPWLVNLLGKLRTTGLVTETDGRWIVFRDPLLPNAAAVLKGLAREHPARAAELLVAGTVAGLVEQVRCNRAIALPVESGISAAVRDFHDVGGVPLKESSELVARLLENEALWPKGRAVRILQIGFGPLTSSLISA